MRRFSAKYTIIAGRRKSQDRLLTERNYHTDNFDDLQIRSFDYLTEIVQERYFAPLPNLASVEMDQVSLAVRNELVNPFRMAIPSAEWRKVAAILEDDHMAAKNASILVDLVSANTRLQAFVDAWQELSEERRQVYTEQIYFMANLEPFRK
jgi:hypothetical protein